MFLVEVYIKEVLLGFLPHEGFLGYIFVFSFLLCFLLFQWSFCFDILKETLTLAGQMFGYVGSSLD